MNSSLHKKGMVVLAGAGPGDPDLITVKAMRYLAMAEVVIVDRLVSDEIISRYVNPKAAVVYAGKQSGKGYSTRQSTINQMLVDYAKKSKFVVRLKGGDVSIFSNVLDELEALVEHQIPYEIVPGITAASGAAAYAGIPLTARRHATAVRFLTYYKSDIVPDGYWKDLAQTDDTLVFYMSAETLGKLVEKLIANNVQSDKAIAVIEQATTPLQKVSVTNVYDYRDDPARQFVSPTLVIIGRTPVLHNNFKWVENYGGSEHYFQPLTKATATLTGMSEIYS
jgi:uroporphyrin-III C-methyltransferase/precorrin-2 dehydrogenase/sirohydrochlorin ferrochelatase/uroporphyrin-III C-methyltransferase